MEMGLFVTEKRIKCKEGEDQRKKNVYKSEIKRVPIGAGSTKFCVWIKQVPNLCSFFQIIFNFLNSTNVGSCPN